MELVQEDLDTYKTTEGQLELIKFLKLKLGLTEFEGLGGGARIDVASPDHEGVLLVGQHIGAVAIYSAAMCVPSKPNGLKMALGAGMGRD